MHGCDVLNKRGFARPYVLSEHILVICIGRNLEISLKRRGIVNGMSAQKLTKCTCSKHNFLGLATNIVKILAS